MSNLASRGNRDPPLASNQQEPYQSTYRRPQQQQHPQPFIPHHAAVPLVSTASLPRQLDPGVQPAAPKDLSDVSFRNELAKLTKDFQRQHKSSNPDDHPWKHKEVCFQHNLLPLLRKHFDGIPADDLKACQCGKTRTAVEQDFQCVKSISLDRAVRDCEKSDKRNRSNLCDLRVDLNSGQYILNIEVLSHKIHHVKRITQPKTKGMLDTVATASFFDTRVYWDIGPDHRLCLRLKRR